jgi:hypothetical protein
MVVTSALCAGCPSPAGRFLLLISVRGWVDPRATVWLEGLDQLKNPLTSLGMKPATFWLVTYCPNQLHYSIPPLTHTCIVSSPCICKLVPLNLWKIHFHLTNFCLTNKYQGMQTEISAAVNIDFTDYGNNCFWVILHKNVHAPLIFSLKQPQIKCLSMRG